MNKQERISKLLQYLDEKSFSINKVGNIVIKSKNNLNTKKLVRANTDFILQKNILTKLLQPEDRIPRKNIAVWLKELNDILDDISLHGTITDKLFTIYNQTSLLLCLTGETQRARDLCNKQINLAITSAKVTPKNMGYILQPLINLGRLERLQRNYIEAIKIFGLLESIVNRKPIHFKNLSVSVSDLIIAMNSCDIFANLITTCSVLEPIKTYLAIGDFNLIIKLYSGLVESNEQKNLRTIIYETLIIAYLFLEQYQKAYDLIIEALDIFPAQFEYIFLFRKIELLHFTKDTQVKLMISQLINFVVYEYKSQSDVNFAYFISEFGFKLVSMDYIEEAIRVFNLAKKSAEEIQDEPLTILCLEAFCKLNPDKEYNSRFQELISNTNYEFIKEKFHINNPSNYENNESKRNLLRLTKRLAQITF